MTRSIVILVILVIVGSLNVFAGPPHSKFCACGTDEPSGDIDVISNVHLANGINRIYNRLGRTSSKQMCVGYAADANNGIVNMTFSKTDVNRAIITNTCKSKKKNGVIECMIEDPYFTSKENCYPAQYFCVHQVVCPHDHTAVIHCSSIGLPKKNGKCLDAVRINSGRVRDMNVCGLTGSGDCFPDIEEAGGSLIRITFTSGFCCQHCGYRLWVRCLPGGQEKGKREIEEHETDIRAKRGSSGFVVPAGATVTYKNYRLTVKLGTKTLLSKWTLRLQVRDDIAFGVGKCYNAKGTANRNFVGYGNMTTSFYKTYYHQKGITPQNTPNSKEREFIKKVVDQFRYDRIFMKSNIKVRQNPKTKRALLTSVFRGRQKKSIAACQSVGETVSSTGRRCGNHGPPGVTPIMCSNAKKYLHSKKPLVKFHATVFLEYEGSKCPPRNGVLVPPGPPPG